MRWRVAGVIALLTAGVATAVLTATARAHTQAAPAVTYTYRIELARGSKDMKDLERRLSEAGRTGWRVSSATVLHFNDEVVVVLEKPEGRQ
jgi:hypothetical protein